MFRLSTSSVCRHFFLLLYLCDFLNLVEALLQVHDSKKIVKEETKQEKQPKSAH